MNDYGFNTTYGSDIINGQLVPVLTMSGMRPPTALAPTYAGRGTVPPTLPSGIQVGVGSGPTSNGEAVAAAAANPASPRLSPVIWLLVFLFVGMLGLRYVHWRG